MAVGTQERRPKTQLTTDPRADVLALDHTISPELAGVVAHHIGNAGMAFHRAGKGSLRDAVDGGIIRLRALSDALNDQAKRHPSSQEVWEAAQKIAGKWLERTALYVGAIHRCDRRGASVTIERALPVATINVQLLNDKPRKTYGLCYSSSDAPGSPPSVASAVKQAVARMLTALPDDLAKWQRENGTVGK